MALTPDFLPHAYSFPLLSTAAGPLQVLFRSISAAGSRLFCLFC